MKSKFKIGDKVKDTDGDIGIITDIYERDNAPNQILVKYSMLPDYMAHEFELERVDG